MKILSLHCDYIKFKPLKKAIKDPEQLTEERLKEIEVKDPLGIFVAVEKSDESNLKKTIDNLVLNIIDLKDKVRADTIVLYPYAHLSSTLSNPGFALEVLEGTQGVLENKKIKVFRAPFGYYKEFELKCKGHPLSELSREIKLEVDIIEQDTVKQPTTNIIKVNEKDEDPAKLLRALSKSKLDTSKLKENDHRILGQKLDLFSFNEASPGSVFWHPKGQVIFNQLANFSRELQKERGYQEVSTPQIFDTKLWKVSGHWDHYKENMFLTDYEGKSSGVKPMNCPGHMLLYRTSAKSYKDLPLRIAEYGPLHRMELSGVLAGLFRVIRLHQDDTHIFCTLDQLESEIAGILELIDTIYKKTFGFKEIYVKLSTRPESFMGDIKDWEKAEESLEKLLKKSKLKFELKKGEGAFYGPKIDFDIEDSLGRKWQCSTIQLDMQLPKRFELTYTGEDGKQHTPLVIHRAIFGSLERFIGVLLEHTSGNLPTWLSPVQVKVLSFTDRNVKAAEKVLKELKEAGIRAEGDFESNTVQDKVRNAALMKIPYVVTIGDKEEEKGTIAIKRRGKDKPEFGVKLKDFLKDITEEIKERR